VYVLDTEQGAIVKRVFPAGEGSITCRSANHDNYPDFVINTDEIRGIGIVVGCIRME
jgi:phage repressor protein C with HTH and peptisase S24 domain